MAQIGTFTRTADGFAGRLRTLALDVELTIVPATSSDADRNPSSARSCVPRRRPVIPAPG